MHDASFCTMTMSRDTVLIVGHSFIRRLERHVRRSGGARRLDGYYIEFLGLPGADVGRLHGYIRRYQDLSRIRAVYLEIGSNDLSTLRPVDDVVDDIIRFAHYLIRYGVRRVVIGEILFRTERLRYWMPISVSQYNYAETQR